MSFNKENYNKIVDYLTKFDKNGEKPTLIAISKNHSLDSIKTAINYGLREFGENKVQEAFSKYKDLKINVPNLKLHLTGPLQRNKVKDALKIFDIFHTLDREKLGLEFFKHLNHNHDKKFFIQINIGMESQKSGIPIKLSNDFIKYCANDLNLNIIGLMCIPPINKDPKEFFFKLKEIADKNNLKYLSMGMSSDYKEALLSGSTHIRVGSLLFGKRL